VPFDGAFSPIHILIVLVVALLVLGPDQLPKIARQAAHGLRELRRVQQHLRAELRDVVSEFDASEPPKPMLPPPEPPEESRDAP
jgi:TatA/E family protein of Tat protein translocase